MQTKDRNKMYVTGKRKRRTAKPERPRKEPEVQILYTPAKPFNRNRFLLHLATVAAVVLAVFFGISIFFKVHNVMVSGAEKYTPWEIKEASGIQDGDALLSLSEAKISAQIREKLPYVGDVRVGIKLPDTVNIEIKELEVVYAVEDSNGAWWLMDAAGRVVDSADVATSKNHTRIIGVQIQEPAVGQQAAAAEEEPPESSSGEQADSLIPTVPPTPARELFSAAVGILSALEHNGVMGKIDTVDVTDLSALTLWYEDRYQVSLGDASRLDYKIGAMKASIQKMGEYQSGYLDVSFTIWQNEVGYRPFEDGFVAKK